MSLAQTRLTEERKAFRKDHPVGFHARPETKADDTLNLLKWNCGVPGKAGTPWEGGIYDVTLVFKEDYPSKAPVCSFPKGFFHLNCFGNGEICLSILGSDWKPSISIKNILLGIQDLLDNPNPNSPANSEALQLWTNNKPAYLKRIKDQAKKYDAQRLLE
ncbi:hypothetical protein ACTA71_011487 [Dictyostelium dimigraforme]